MLFEEGESKKPNFDYPPSNPSCQIEAFHNSIQASNLPSTLLLPSFYTESEKLISLLVSAILKKNIANFKEIDAFELKPNESGNILMEEIIPVLSFASKTSIASEYKFIIIHNACSLSISVANALLKALEEPPKNTFFLLFYTDKKNILPTIRSRSIFIDFKNTKENFEFIAKNIGIAAENIENLINLSGVKLSNIQYFTNENIFNLLQEFQGIITKPSYMNLKKFIQKYSKVKNFEKIIFFALEKEINYLIKRCKSNLNLINIYFSFLSWKKYVKLYNTNFELTLHCTINSICAEKF